MARKAKTDTNYVISCSHCLNHEFKLNDIHDSPTSRATDRVDIESQKLIENKNANNQNQDVELVHINDSKSVLVGR